MDANARMAPPASTANESPRIHACPLALPGFALVEYAHRQLTDPPLPIHEDIPVFVIPTLLAILALSPASTKKKGN